MFEVLYDIVITYFETRKTFKYAYNIIGYLKILHQTMPTYYKNKLSAIQEVELWNFW